LRRRLFALFRGIFFLFSKVFSVFRKLFTLFSKLIQKLQLLPPCRKVSSVFQRFWKVSKPPEYHFLPYVTSVLRVLGWAVLVIGVVASIVLGLQIIENGLTIMKTELRGLGLGVSAILLGIIGSFLAWLFLLVTRELVYLFIDVKENTRKTARSLARKSR